jgi:hypothetical protein
MTRSDIADYFGLTIETVIQTFTKLKHDVMIQLPCSSLSLLETLPGMRLLATCRIASSSGCVLAMVGLLLNWLAGGRAGLDRRPNLQKQRAEQRFRITSIFLCSWERPRIAPRST